jgi:hypothetical protein
MLALLERNMNQRLTLALFILAVSGLLLAFEKLESGGFVTVLIGLMTAYYGQAAFDRWVATKGTEP